MAYEKSDITDNAGAIPNQSMPIMREEKVIDPYYSSSKKALAAASVPVQTAPTGQSTINSGQASPVEEGKPEETVTLSPQVAALARKEQRFRQQELNLKKQEEALATERAEIAELKALKAKLVAKDYSGIENLVKYDEYTNYLIEKEGNLSPAEKAVKQLHSEVEALKASQKDDVTKRFEAAVNERRRAVTELVQSKPEFSRIKKAKAEEAVVKHILDTWEHESVDLTPEQAAKEVEEVLLEKAKAWKALLDEEEVTPKPTEVTDDKKQLPPLKAPIRTLTNNMAVTGEIKRPVKSFQHMSDTERYAEARRRAEEKLKQGNRI